VAQFFQEVKQLQAQMTGDQTDPLVELKKQEIQQTGQRDQARMAMEQERLALDKQREMNDMAVDQAKLAQKGAANVPQAPQNPRQAPGRQA
jgi:hypothetical protein